MHWSQYYVGKPYSAANCAQLAMLVLAEQFNKSIHLPLNAERNVFGLSAMIEQHKQAVATPTDTPQEGDAVLMIGRGRLNHIGIYCLINQQPYVLHALRNAKQTCLHKLTQLPHLGLKIEGYYQWVS